jgi:hypothetical protein
VGRLNALGSRSPPKPTSRRGCLALSHDSFSRVGTGRMGRSARCTIRGGCVLRQVMPNTRPQAICHSGPAATGDGQGHQSEAAVVELQPPSQASANQSLPSAFGVDVVASRLGLAQRPSAQAPHGGVEDDVDSWISDERVEVGRPPLALVSLGKRQPNPTTVLVSARRNPNRTGPRAGHR